MSNFADFDNKVNMDELKKQIQDAKDNVGNYPEIPAGTYTCKLKHMELGKTKDGRPMFKAQMQILEGEFKKFNIFMNRAIYGTKNDASMIYGVVTWLNNLDLDTKASFEGYGDFEELVLDMMEEVEELKLTYEVEYDPNAFNTIKIVDVFES